MQYMHAPQAAPPAALCHRRLVSEAARSAVHAVDDRRTASGASSTMGEQGEVNVGRGARCSCIGVDVVHGQPCVARPHWLEGLDTRLGSVELGNKRSRQVRGCNIDPGFNGPILGSMAADLQAIDVDAAC